MENFEDIPMVSQPNDLKINLFPHQLASVYMMEELESTHCVVNTIEKTFTDIGINGDMTGYGKTLSMIALIIRDRMEWDLEVPHLQEIVYPSSCQHIKQYVNRMYPKNNTTLILAGPSVVHQWLKEFSYSDLSVLDATKKKNALNFDIDDYDVIIVSTTTYNTVVEKYYRMAWKRFIYDEPTTLKVPSMKNIVSGFTWFLTATPSAIISRHKSSRRSYMYNIVGDGFFNRISSTITVKNNDEFVKLSFTMPSTTHIYHNCYVPTFRTVNGIVSDRILKMIEGGNISGAIEALGGKNTDNIVDLVKKNKEIELEEVRGKIRIWELRADVEKIEEWKCKEKSIINQLEELDNRFGKILEENCSICFNKLEKPVMETGCQNIFCGGCLLKWLNTKGSCPLCRKVVSRDNLIYINKDKFVKEEEEKKNKSKQDTIIEILENNKSGRFIIFSDWDESFDVIRDLLRSNRIEFVEIKGSVGVRTRNIERFRNAEVNVVFLNSRTDSSGINMQETTDIILYHTMNDTTTKQIIGRANRIGRKLPLVVHHLVSV